MRHISIPSNRARPNRRVCEVCKSGFCSICGTPFICRKCLYQLNTNDQQAIRLQSDRYRKKAAGGTAMTAAGAVLLMTAGETVYIYWLMAYYSSLGFSIFAGAPIFEIATGLGLFIAGLSTLSSSKAAVLNAIKQASTNWQSSGPASSGLVRDISWVASPPVIPSSAYVPVIQEVPYQPPSIPQSAYIPEPQPSPATPSAAAPRARSKTPSARTGTSALFCGQCGESFPDVAGLKFCPSCGSPRE